LIINQSNKILINKILPPLIRVVENPSYAIMRILGRFNIVRALMISLHHQEFNSESAAKTDSIFPELNIAEIVDQIETDGYYLGLQLPQNTVRKIFNFAASSPCYGNRNPSKGFSYQNKEKILADNPDFLLGSFYNVSELCPAVKSIEEDPQLLAIAAHYLNSQPILQGTNVWWSFAVDASEQDRSDAAQMYHFDLDDYRFIKFFFYLTDVDEHGGPHVIVKGTHKSKKFAHQLKLRRFSDREMVSEYGADKVTVLCGTAGYGFIEDTLCFHKGNPPQDRDRLVVQVEFGLRDYGVQHTNIDPQSLKQITASCLT
jgi:hypothetical protein